MSESLLQQAVRKHGPDNLAELLGPERLAVLRYEWRAWARPEQIAPEGDWLIWLLLAGRGFGKSRSGAEWCREQAKAMPGSHGALVGPTAADTRDVMVKAIIEASPKGEVDYEPSKRLLTWANGSTASTYSAEEPDRLRGPNHGWAWADECCLIGSTLVRTSAGEVPMASIRAGDLVHTRNGLRAVTAAAMTNVSAQVYELVASNGSRLIGTENHPIFVAGKGFVPLRCLVPGDMLKTWPATVLNGTAKPGTCTGTTIETAPASYCIARSTSRPMARYRARSSCTTSTRTKPTMLCQTSWRYRTQSMSPAMSRAVSAHGPLKNEAPTLCSHGATSARGWCRAHSAIAPSTPPGSGRGSVGKIVAPNIVAHWHHYEHASKVRGRLEKISGRRSSARFAALRSRPIRTRKHAQETADTVSVLGVAPLTRLEPVFNIEVAGEHEYYANGVLTHNCAWAYLGEVWDMLAMTLRIGERPRLIVTTTPRPVELLMGDGQAGRRLGLLSRSDVTVTRGSTFDNSANLSATFLGSIRERYEGTRLGQQELYGLVLDDLVGALFAGNDIDAQRVREAPLELRRTVVAVDPATTSGETADETGIVVCAIDMAGHGYVLADYSGRYTPEGWAQRVAWAYGKHRADRVVAERNQGGEMVERVLRTAAPNIAYRGVHVRNGKVMRAEPVAALYEQRKVSHVGIHSELEGQMCRLMPEGVLDGNDDRVDALVHALTELMLGEPNATYDAHEPIGRRW